MNSKRASNLQSQNDQIMGNKGGSSRNPIRRSLGGQIIPKQTIEMLTFTNHTKCGCVNRMNF